MTFSEHDSRAIEAAYQKLADEYDPDLNKEVENKEVENKEVENKEVENKEVEIKSREGGITGQSFLNGSKSNKGSNTSIDDAGQDQDTGGKIKVPVHEDFLFDVDVERRELSPVYCKPSTKQYFVSRPICCVSLKILSTA